MNNKELHSAVNTILNESLARKYQREGHGRYFPKELIPSHYFEDEEVVKALVRLIVENFSEANDVSAKRAAKKG